MCSVTGGRREGRELLCTLARAGSESSCQELWKKEQGENENGVAFQPLLAAAASGKFRVGLGSQPSLMGCSFINCQHIHSPSCPSLCSRAGRAEIPQTSIFSPFRLRVFASQTKRVNVFWKKNKIKVANVIILMLKKKNKPSLTCNI